MINFTTGVGNEKLYSVLGQVAGVAAELIRNMWAESTPSPNPTTPYAKPMNPSQVTVVFDSEEFEVVKKNRKVYIVSEFINGSQSVLSVDVSYDKAKKLIDLKMASLNLPMKFNTECVDGRIWGDKSTYALTLQEKEL